jgi:nicotinate dehydrogenase subunit B
VPDRGPTWASLSVQVAGAQSRQAADTARHALLDMAADRLATSRDNLEVRDGIVRVRGDGGQVTWSELVDGQIIDLAVDEDAQVKSAAEHRLVGRALAWVTATERPWRVTPAAVWTVSPHLHPTIGWLTNR